MKQKSILSLLVASAAVPFWSCNNDVFIDNIEIDISNQFIQPSGGTCRVVYNGDGINGLRFGVARLKDGKQFGIVEGTPELTVMPDGSSLFSNDLIEFSFRIEGKNCVDLTVDHSYYSDTIAFTAIALSDYGNVRSYAYILPAQPFLPGEISYNLDSWSSECVSYTANAYLAANAGDKELDLKVLSKGQLVASREVKFAPFDGTTSSAVLSPYTKDCIFPIPNYTPDMWQPTMSTDRIPFTTAFVKLADGALLADRDYSVKLPPHTSCKIVISAEADQYGFDYTLPVHNSDGIDLTLNGILRLRHPISFNITAEALSKLP